MTCEIVIAGKAFSAGVNNINQHIRPFHLSASVQSLVKISLLACIFIKYDRYFQKFIHSDPMHPENTVINAVARIQLRICPVPCSLGKAQKLRISCNRIGPEYTLDIDHKTAETQFGKGIGQVILFKSSRNTAVSCCFVTSLEGAEEHRKRPGHRFGLRTETPFRTIGRTDFHHNLISESPESAMIIHIWICSNLCHEIVELAQLVLSRNLAGLERKRMGKYIFEIFIPQI